MSQVNAGIAARGKLNPNIELRNSKQFSITKIQMTKTIDRLLPPATIVWKIGEFGF
jgi:hypothetical protein